MKKIRPLGDRVLVQPSEPENKTPGGIIIPDNVKERPVQGTVIAIGPGRILEDGHVVPIGGKIGALELGDLVLYGKYAGQDVQLDGVEFKILKEEDVLAVLD